MPETANVLEAGTVTMLSN